LERRVSRCSHGATTGADHNDNGARGHDDHVGHRFHDHHVGLRFHDDHVGLRFHDDHVGLRFHDDHVGLYDYIIDNAPRCEHNYDAATHHDPDHSPAL
jgi:hypothetical protein